ncbi:folate-sensitive fragile site protein Fra10Ac1-domain-containing protein [Panaeolus papilionaceus]|nr:folate-sensitive fragile site protein Fra10Ac1-domain-containing protein [Panaeolus papilionaceus]
MALYRSSGSFKPNTQPVGITEFEILKATHRFLRDEDNPTVAPDEQDVAKTVNPSSSSKSWNEQLAEKYYASLYREFALCDLKHYKSGNFALRWRSEDEVLSGAGETTCGNTRCEYHHTSTAASWSPRQKPNLVSLELPFAYVEMGETKSALVKVVLCPKCVKKLMWKHTKEKEKRKGKRSGEGEEEPAGCGDRENQREKKGKRKREESDSDDNGKDRVEREYRRNKDGMKAVAFSTDASGDQDRRDRTTERSERESDSYSCKRDSPKSRERDRRRHHSSERHSARHHSRHEHGDDKQAKSKEIKRR